MPSHFVVFPGVTLWQGGFKAVYGPTGFLI